VVVDFVNIFLGEGLVRLHYLSTCRCNDTRRRINDEERNWKKCQGGFISNHHIWKFWKKIMTNYCIINFKNNRHMFKMLMKNTSCKPQTLSLLTILIVFHSKNLWKKTNKKFYTIKKNQSLFEVCLRSQAHLKHTFTNLIVFQSKKALKQKLITDSIYNFKETKCAWDVFEVNWEYTSSTLFLFSLYLNHKTLIKYFLTKVLFKNFKEKQSVLGVCLRSTSSRT